MDVVSPPPLTTLLWPVFALTGHKLYFMGMCVPSIKRTEFYANYGCV